jgi:stage II sporulation protein D
MRRFLTLALIVCLLHHVGCNPRPDAQEQPESAAKPVAPGVPVVRVRLLEGQTAVTLRANQPSVVKINGNLVNLSLPTSAVQVSLEPTGWRIGNAGVGAGELTIQPAVVGSVSVNNAAYRGQYRFVSANGKIDVINDVTIDDYLKGVVAKEMLAGWHPEAYKAQAIIARTYALYEKGTVQPGRSWDLYPDERSQVYGGLAGETAKSVDAVEATRGVVVAYGNPGAEKIFKAYFSSCCGGIGQNPADAINEPYHPALHEQSVGDLCKASPRFTWGPITITRTEITRRIKLWGKRNGRSEERITRVMRIDKSHQNSKGRPVRYMITDVSGTKYSLSGEELRWALNTDAPKDSYVYSSWIEPAEPKDESIVIRGHGFGHGIGMCQWCTQTRALKGVGHEEIVRLSYPGSVIVKNAY